ncbi:nicotinate-nucleotide-dimethylbenzimidazole phosphoribosyltransferase [Sphingomonas sp. PP-CE-3A-406]|uniref:nicotinate-nucleotide--dimethylbenzimidazole phosphoribosyltransferase n=1 Tax=Sphingomonas sp. PP-CE-3A-406 TaxID=2135659 RepID=UPI000EF8F329|nr:nicotinate-nucleotide--dimethylbenzimidazole phosphoribosyltransferase [Sphingomonas sp. PP-CE-3A-406]RMB55128.1 nicotinate-nucleotide-dimethylbenzimidazole phosphoribosyltransferase [Sphingomonas sp. PP-CE-3A-406]
MTAFATPAAFLAALRGLPQADAAARSAAIARQGDLTKPPGSLGRLEDIAVFMAGWQGNPLPRLDRGSAVVFAGNHGIVARGVSAFPASVTAQMVANFEHGGAAINALSRAAGLDLKIVSLDLDRPTTDFTEAAAMSEDECLAAINAGAAAVADAPDLVVLGEMGIGNSTTAAALCLASFGGSASDWVGPGTGVDGEGIGRKVAVVEAGIALHRDALTTPFETLRRLGGRELAAIAGAVVAARLAGVPVMLDGFICCAAVAPLAAACPDIVAHCLAGHVSAEPGHRHLLERMRLEPLLSLGMRLGEGSGAATATLLVRAALAAHAEMATFAEAGVSSA